MDFEIGEFMFDVYVIFQDSKIGIFIDFFGNYVFEIYYFIFIFEFYYVGYVIECIKIMQDIV